MSGKARNFRRRGGDDDDGDETPAVIAANGNSTQSQAKPVASSGKRKRSSTLAPKSLLSFAEDEESEDSPFTRPSRPSSHKLSSVKGRSGVAPSLPSNVQPQAGTYTKEALLELQKNTKTLASGSRPTQPESMEPVIVLKMEKGRDSEDDEARATDDIGPEIPDQAMIDVIRAKRQRLRQDEYIVLDGGSNHGEADGLSDEDEPEFQWRIGSFGEKIDSGKRGVFENYEDKAVQKDVGDDSVYEEDKMWEEEQVRKRIKFGFSQQAELAKKVFHENVCRLKESYGRTVASLSKTEENLAFSLSNVTTLENSLAAYAAGEKYIFMQNPHVICS